MNPVTNPVQDPTRVAPKGRRKITSATKNRFQFVWACLGKPGDVLNGCLSLPMLALRDLSPGSSFVVADHYSRYCFGFAAPSVALCHWLFGRGLVFPLCVRMWVLETESGQDKHTTKPYCKNMVVCTDFMPGHLHRSDRSLACPRLGALGLPVIPE